MGASSLEGREGIKWGEDNVLDLRLDGGYWVGQGLKPTESVSFTAMLITPPFAKIWKIVLNGSPKTRQKHPTDWGFTAPSSASSRDSGSKGEGAARGTHHSLRVNLSPIHHKAGRHLQYFPFCPSRSLGQARRPDSEPLAQLLFRGPRFLTNVGCPSVQNKSIIVTVSKVNKTGALPWVYEVLLRNRG